MTKMLLALVTSSVALLATVNGHPIQVTSPAPTKASSVQAGVAKLIAQEDARRELADLNKHGRLTIPGLDQKMYSGGDLKKENCFGILLSNGARILGESKGKDYGFTLRWATATYSPFMPVIGLLFVDGPLQIQGKSTTPGPYVVITSGVEFRLVRSTSFHDSVDLSGELLKRLDTGGLRPGSARPRLNAIVEDGVAYLEIGGNKLRVAVP